MTTIEDPAAPIAIPVRDEAKIARRERIRLLLGSPTFLVGLVLVGAWVICALLGTLIAPQDPQADDVLNNPEMAALYFGGTVEHGSCSHDLQRGQVETLHAHGERFADDRHFPSPVWAAPRRDRACRCSSGSA